jgi:hypothetical protein
MPHHVIRQIDEPWWPAPREVRVELNGWSSQQVAWLYRTSLHERWRQVRSRRSQRVKMLSTWDEDD